jgi:preprotein translocase subunit SecE
MSTKAIASNGEQPVNGLKNAWANFNVFLSDVRGEMRKIVTPSRKEVQATTTVVLVAVFIFGLYFFIVDTAFDKGMGFLLHKLGGL